MKREEPGEKLHFAVREDAGHASDLIQEATVGDWLYASIARVGWGSAQQWRVLFHSRHGGSSDFELSWETFQKITQNFAAFREEMDSVADTERLRAKHDSSSGERL